MFLSGIFGTPYFEEVNISEFIECFEDIYDDY